MLDSGLLVFEGVDGVGKSTVSRLVAEGLRASGHQLEFWDKKDTAFPNPFVERQMSAIKVALWDYPREANVLDMGNMHWMLLMASWFAAIDRQVVQPAREAGRLTVIDNWYYKFAARFLLKSDFDHQAVFSVFSLLAQPTKVIFLSVKPEVAAERKKGRFFPSECGVLEAPHLASAETFVAYQTQVQEKILSLCDRDNTIVVDATYGNAQEVAGKVLEQLLGVPASSIANAA
jgi:thymidylate kinase